MGIFTRMRSILSKAISILVILLNLALITFVWIVQDDLSSSAVVIFAEVDNLAQVMRNVIARIEPEIGNMRDLVGDVEEVSEEIAQNVSEEGIIPRLLPQTVVDSLTTSSQSLRDNFIAVYDLLGATSDVLLALDAIPFVEMPERGLSTVATLQGSMEEFSGQVESLKNTVIDVRAKGGARISQVTDAAAFLGSAADNFLSDLIQIDTDLDTIQLSVREFQRLAPPMILSSAIILSLLASWVVYSQVLIMCRSASLTPEKTIDVSKQQEPPSEEGRF